MSEQPNHISDSGASGWLETQVDESDGYATSNVPGGWGGPKESPDASSATLEDQVARAANAQRAINEMGFGPQDWEGFGKAVLLLCDTPFAEWNISQVPGLTQAGVQVRLLADRYRIRR